MRILMLLGLPLVAAAVAYSTRSNVARQIVLVTTSLSHAGLTTWCWLVPEPFHPDFWLSLDHLGLVILTIVSIVFLLSTSSACRFLQQHRFLPRSEVASGAATWFHDEPEPVFLASQLLLLGAMTLVTVSQHLGLLWVAVEATTLACAPLIYFPQRHRALEATWKYLLVGSVGIALALIGNVLIVVAAHGHPAGPIGLNCSELMARAGAFHQAWFEAAFLFFLVGYGTNLGLAPLHQWLPDVQSESPAPVAALMSGGQQSCLFLVLCRIHGIYVGAGSGPFSGNLLIIAGLLSVAVGAIFLVRQTDYQRMLAYSSIAQMGLLACGLGLGGRGTYAALLHVGHHALAKAALFLLAGNIVARYGTKRVDEVYGLRTALPLTGALWVVGYLAVVGVAPFATFGSTLLLVRAFLDARSWLAAGLLLFLLAVVFIGMGSIVLKMWQGRAEPPRIERRPEPLWSLAPALLLLALVLGQGVVPHTGWIERLQSAALSLQPTDLPQQDVDPAQIESWLEGGSLE